MKKIIRSTVLFLAALGASAAPVFADPLESVPDPLRPWVSWVLHDVGDQGCPPQYNSAQDKRCVWAGRLELQLGGAGGAFRQTVKAYRKTWFALPGDAKRWPQNVTLDGAAAAVVSKNDLPGMWLPSGEHKLAGSFVWQQLPDKLTLARETVLVALTLKGRIVASPFVDESGLLWLTQQRAQQGEPAAAVRLRVFRLLDDGIPATLTTRLTFDASSTTEAVYGPVLPDGAVPLALQSALPARIEPNGSVRVQLRPGQWEITLVARLPGPVTELARAPARAPWPEDEVWSFAAQPNLRVVTPSGPAAIDPQQADVPREWKSYPAFCMRPADRLKLAETRRGDPQPEPDRLNLQRRIWLDFDGAGYTVSDHVDGALSRTWRLEMEPPFVLGRAGLEGNDQLITRLSAGAPAGIELRQGSLALAADSRIDGDTRTLPVTGWRQDFQGVAAELNLPAGWRLITATGVDRAQGAWTAQWTLLDFFLVLVAALAVRQMWGARWALLTLLMLTLSWHEPDAPGWVWLALLASTALVRVVPDGRLQAAARWARYAMLLVLFLIGLPFAVGQIREAIYPVLEQPYQQISMLDILRQGVPMRMGEAVPDEASTAAPATPAPVDMRPARPAMKGEAVEEAQLEEKGAPGVSTRSFSSMDKAETALPRKQKFNLDEIDPKAVVQTGPGLPTWRWRSYSLQWSGPVERTQTMTLWLTSPIVNALLNFLRVALLVLVALHMAGVRLPRPRLPARGMGAAAIVLCALYLAPHDSWARGEAAQQGVEIDDKLLEQLKARLTAPHDCHPGCAEISRMAIEAKGGALTLRLGVAAAIDTAIPMPGRAGQWQPRQVLLDGRPAALARDARGVAWMPVTAGTHQVVLEGALADSQSLGLPMKPRLVTVHAGGYRIEGVDAAGVPADALRISALGAHAAVREQRGQIPSFVRIERTFELGLHWQVLTRVVRVSADTAPVTIDLPLLPGETVVSEGVRTARGRVQAVLPAQAAAMEWRSALTERDTIALESTKQAAWVEVWRFDSGALWHVEFKGLAPVHHQSDGRWLPEWRPWPGETLTAHISRPEAIAGQALTIDGSEIEIAPGLRTTDVKLALALRSSRGGEHTITLPENVELLGATINGTSQPLRLEANTLRIPVLPGAQRVELSWREPSGIGLLFGTPQVKLNAPSVNASVKVRMPPSRWVLWVRGPRIGPAILFWGVLLALIPISVALARIGIVPLAARDWFLLGLGLTQSPVIVGPIILAWFFGLALREKRADKFSNREHNTIQVMLGMLTVVALVSLVYAVSDSLLGAPEMQIAGNGSSAMQLNWYQDRASDALPGAQVLSVPLLVYRLAMLAWSLWLASRLIGWLKWGWRCFAAGGYWRRVIRGKAA